MKIFKSNKSKKPKSKPVPQPQSDPLHKHPFMVPIATLFGLIVISSGFFLAFGGQTLQGEDVRRVNVYLDDRMRTLPTRAKTVKELLSRLNVQLQEEDVVEPGLNSPILGDDFSVNVYRAKPVTVVDESGKKITAKIAESTPAGIAKKAGFRVYPEDKVTFADPDLAIKDKVVGDLIMIDRAVLANVNLYGNAFSLRTHAETVGDLLVERHIKEIQGDNILPSKDTKITEGITIFIVPAGKKVAIREEAIPAPEETKLDATKKADYFEILEPGREGKRVVVYELKIIDGREVSRKEIQSLVSIEPVKKVVLRGTKTAGFDGGFGAALASLRSCEGSYTSNTGNGYYGAYQFAAGTWRTNAPAGYRDILPSDAPPAVQDQAAATLYQRSGWTPWPACSRNLGLQDIYR
ncbi:transglycosylase family protein [Candidatus Parcubacteria bacterium]|nr:transglycosylase family protein [Candidatus Parcubacteria bacterium]